MYTIEKKDGYIISIGTGNAGEEISEEYFNEVLSVIKQKPARTATTDFRLKEDLVWEEYEHDPDPEPEPTAEEVVDILLGVSE